MQVETYNGVPDHLGPGMLANAQGLVHGISTLAPGGSGGIATDGLTPQWEPEIVYRAGFPTVTRPPAGVDGRMSHLQVDPVHARTHSLAREGERGRERRETRETRAQNRAQDSAQDREKTRCSMQHAAWTGLAATAEPSA